MVKPHATSLQPDTPELGSPTGAAGGDGASFQSRGERQLGREAGGKGGEVGPPSSRASTEGARSNGSQQAMKQEDPMCVEPRSGGGAGHGPHGDTNGQGARRGDITGSGWSIISQRNW